MKHAVDDDLDAQGGGVKPPPFAPALREYQGVLGGMYLLFTYMDFIQRAGELLRDRLGNRLQFLERMETHPRASERLLRLELTCAGELLYTSKLERYGRELLDNVFDYVSSLGDEELFASLG